eukprot:1300272-Alexandrium_andersonii.AAC.1
MAGAPLCLGKARVARHGHSTVAKHQASSGKRAARHRSTHTAWNAHMTHIVAPIGTKRTPND